MKMRGNNYGTINDFSESKIGTVNIASDKPIYPIDPYKNETTLGKVIVGQILNLFIGVIAGLISSFIVSGPAQGKLEPWHGIALLVAAAVLAFVAIVLTLTALSNLWKCIKLRKRGAFIAMTSKLEQAGHALDKMSKEQSDTAYKSVGKVYKNIDGTVYELKGCSCPICQSEPIGKMFFRYNKTTQSFELVCKENNSHVLEFDYKELW